MDVADAADLLLDSEALTGFRFMELKPHWLRSGLGSGIPGGGRGWPRPIGSLSLLFFLCVVGLVLHAGEDAHAPFCRCVGRGLSGVDCLVEGPWAVSCGGCTLGRGRVGERCIVVAMGEGLCRRMHEVVVLLFVWLHGVGFVLRQVKVLLFSIL